MSQREVRAFDYVNHPYEAVREALRGDPGGILAGATRVAEARTSEIVASLSVDIKGIEVSKEISIRVGAIREEEGPRLSRTTHVALEWEAKGSPGLFPVMKADLAIYPLSGTETQIELRGHYAPPLGALGGALDALAGHRIAEASVHRFVGAVAEELRRR